MARSPSDKLREHLAHLSNSVDLREFGYTIDPCLLVSIINQAPVVSTVER